MVGSADLIEHISAAGIDPFTERLQSDHRGLILDINLKNWASHTPGGLAPSSARAVQLNKPADVQKFRRTVLEELEKMGTPHRLRELIATNAHVPQDQLQVQLDTLDTEMTNALLHAEQKLRRPHKSPWSIQLLQARKLVAFWNMWLSELRTGRN